MANPELTTYGSASLSNAIETPVIAAANGLHREVFLINLYNPNTSTIVADIRDSLGGTVRLTLAVPPASSQTIVCDGFSNASPNAAWTCQLTATPTTPVRVQMMARSFAPGDLLRG